MEIFLLSIAILFLFLGITGSFAPVIPGPPLGWVGLLLFYFTSYSHLSLSFLLVSLGITLLITIGDFILPTYLTKKFGGSKAGQRGALVGTIGGMFFGIFGILLGPFVGALLGELLRAPKDTSQAFKSAWGSFVGFLMSTGVKLIWTVFMLWRVLKDLIWAN